MIYVFWTCANLEEAEKIIRGLLEKRLIACASVLPKILSLYRWKGEIERAEEIKALLKTRPELFDAVATYIKAHCSYEVPEIASVQTDQVLPAYAAWLSQETSHSS